MALPVTTHACSCARGAVSALPSARVRPRVRRWRSRVSRLTALVRMSAGLWAPRTLYSSKSPRRRPSCTQLSDGEVPDAPDAASAADPDRGCGVRVHPDGHVQAEVSAPGLNAKGFCCALDDAVGFCFCRTQRDRFLRARPVFDQMGAS